jgi:hypothetical protein
MIFFSIQEAMSGQKPSNIKVFIAGHKGLDPSNPEQLSNETTMDRLVSFDSKF